MMIAPMAMQMQRLAVLIPAAMGGGSSRLLFLPSSPVVAVLSTGGVAEERSALE